MTKGWDAVRVIAHRCGGSLAPENSLAGLNAAARAGFLAVEFDVMLTADGVPVVIHDETLDRTTGGTGRVADRTLAQLRHWTCGKGWQGFENEPIPTLDQVLDRCHALGLLPNVEIKPSFGADVATGRVVAERAMNQWAALGGRPSEVLLSSFSVAALDAAQQVAPALPRACLFETIPPDWRGQVEAVSAVAIHCAVEDFEAGLAAAATAGLALRCYTVNDPARADGLFRQGVQAVYTDDLAQFTAFL